MTPNYLNSLQSSPFLGSSNIEDDRQFHHQLFGPSFHPQHDASSSSHSFHFYFNPTQDQAGYNYHNELVNHQHQQKLDQGNESVAAYGGSYDNSYQVQNKVEKGLTISFGSNEGKQKIGAQEANNDDKNNSAKWMLSSKMRMMHKNRKGGEREDSQKLPFNKNNESIDSQDHGSNCSSFNSNNPIRVCSDCNTTKTPLWRSGPKGPKSLCNACGIRQRKARRALAAAAAIADETTPSPPPPPTKTVKIKLNHQKAKNNYGINGLSTVPFKKRCRITTTTTTTTTNASLAVESSSDQEPTQAKKLGFEDFLINLSNKLAFHHVFPQDEKEAAILLMALSCGLVHG
ncbi:hypothetical protein Leryth_007819 [Lithospermum erythrorhizon]|nr:hypothetical protein Leryth_007819 [Lithospermum erythrorhizon]